MENPIPPNLGEIMLGFLRAINETDEFFDEVATMMRKLYDALIRAGFTEDQAVRIVAGFASKGDK